MNEAAMVALEERLDSANETSISYTCSIRASHFERALCKIAPSVTDKVCLFSFPLLVWGLILFATWCAVFFLEVYHDYFLIPLQICGFLFFFQQREYYEALSNKYQAT